MKTYTVYLPSYTHDPLPIGKLTYQLTINSAIFSRDGFDDMKFASVAAALDGIQKIYPSAFIEEE